MKDLPVLNIEGKALGAAYITGTTSGLQALLEAIKRAILQGKTMEDFNAAPDRDDYTLVITVRNVR
jgi:hypothetical protein